MSHYDCVVIGSSGLLGKEISGILKKNGIKILEVNSHSFRDVCHKKITCNYLINANGNSYRFKANQDPSWDYYKSVDSIEKSLNIISSKYVFFSTIEIYSDRSSYSKTNESSEINVKSLDFYAFHKYLAELLLLKRHQNPIIIRLAPVISASNTKGPFFDLKNGTLFMQTESKLCGISLTAIQSLILQIVSGLELKGIYNLCNPGSVRVKDLIKKYKLHINCIKEDNLILDQKINTKKIEEIMKLNTLDTELQYFFSNN